MNVNILALPVFTRQPAAADARMAYGDHPLQFGDLRLPSGSGPYPTAVVIHGGAWTGGYGLDHVGHMAAALTARGIATWTIEFRRVGDEGGGYPNTLLDVAAALDYLRQLARDHPIDPTMIVPVGHSSGGHLALWAAGRRRIPLGDPLYSASPMDLRAVVSIAGIGDLRKHWQASERARTRTEGLIGGSPDEHPGRYGSASPAELLPLGLPIVLIHGVEDASVPLEYSVSFAAACVSAGDDATIIPVQEAGHFEVIDPESAQWPIVEEALVTAVDRVTGRSRQSDIGTP